MDLAASSVRQLAVHRVGNKLRDERIRLSSVESPINDELSALLLGGYLNSISAERNQYQFHHETDLDLNETRHYIGQFFRGEISFLEASRRLATHLYENSLHPNIRQGDLLVILFEGIRHDGHPQRAVGIFKSEVLDNYLEIRESGNNLRVVPSVGINPNLIDKGALILEHGDLVYAVDRFGNKTKFWIDDFLKVKKSADTETCTKVMSFIAGKVAEAIPDAIDRRRYNESISRLCEMNEALDVDMLAGASSEFIDPVAYETTVTQAQRRFGLVESANILAPGGKVSQKLSRKISRLELRYGVSLILPEEINLSDVRVKESPDGELVFTIRMRRGRER